MFRLINAQPTRPRFCMPVPSHDASRPWPDMGTEEVFYANVTGTAHNTLLPRLFPVFAFCNTLLCKKLLYKYAKQGIFFGSSLCPASVLRECYTNHSGSLLSYQWNSGPCTTVVRTIPCHTILCTVVPCNTINTIPWTTMQYHLICHASPNSQKGFVLRWRLEGVVFAYFHLEYHPRCAWLCPDTVTSHGDKGSKRATQVFGSLAWRVFFNFHFHIQFDF